MNLDRDGYDSKVLRFAARLLVDNECDKQRRFVLSYFMSDDTILVNVLPESNAGMAPGKFIERSKAKKPDKFQSVDPSVPTDFYSGQDLYVGSIISINSHRFLLTAADEYVFDFMERREHVEQFPHSNHRVILDKIVAMAGEHFKAMMARLMKDDPMDSGEVIETIFRAVLDQFIGYDLSEHEIHTLVRKKFTD